MQATYDPTFVAFLERCAGLFDEWPRLQEAARRLRELAQSAPDPFRVAIVGRMKAGKSTLINSLIGRPLAITNAEEATATINVVSHGTDDQAREFVAVWKDGREERFSLDRLAPDWSGKDAAVIERARQVRHLQLFSPAEKLREFEIIDTPGTGSAVEAHESVTRDFLRPEAIEESLAQGRKADAIIYVISSSGREADSEALALFGEGRLSAADPYNSLCVFHKWDGPETEEGTAHACAGRRAQRLHEQLNNKVLTVLPVSGPLGLAAQQAPDEFFLALLEVIQTQNARTLARISVDTRWDEDPARRNARAAYALPWFCFLYLVEILLREQPASPAEARRLCLKFSRLPELEALLQQHFFAHAMTIKQCQLLRKAAESVEPGIRMLSRLAADELADVERGGRAAKLLTEPDLRDWAQRKSEDARTTAGRIQALALNLSGEWSLYRERLEGLQRDLQVLRALHAEDSPFPPGDHAAIRSVCESGADPATLPQPPALLELLATCRRAEARAFDAEERLMHKHVIGRIQQAYQKIKTPSASAP